MAIKAVTLDTSQLAKLLDITPQHVRRLAGEGILERARDETGELLQGRWEMIKNNHAYIHYLKSQARWDDSSETKRATLTNRKIGAEAELAELRLMQFKGKLFPWSDVAFFIGSMLTRFKARMQSIPQRVAKQLRGQTDEKIIRRVIGDEIDRGLKELSMPTPDDLRRQSEELLATEGADEAALKASANGSEEESDDTPDADA